MNDRDKEVEKALRKLAGGFYYTEQVVASDGEVVTVKRYEKPNIEAIRFLMTNKTRDVGSQNSGMHRSERLECRQVKGGTFG